MRAVPFHLQGKGVLDVTADISGLISGKWSNEPTSVLEQRRSPSLPTSTSTLSTSLGGGGGSGSTDTSGVAAVSDNPLHKWPSSQEDSSGGKEEWASELQSIPAGLEMGSGGGGGGGEKCSAGGGMEDWENMLSESAGNEQSFFRWFMGDLEDPSLKQLLQSGGSSEFETGFGLVDSGLGFEGGVSASVNVPLAAVAGSDFNLNSNGSSNRLLSTQNPSHITNFKGSFVGSNNSSSSSSSANGHLLPLPAFHHHHHHHHHQQQQQQHQQQQQQLLEAIDEKPQLFNPAQLLLNHQHAHPHQNPGFLLPLQYTQQEQQQQQHILLPPQPKRHQPTIIDPSCQFPKAPFADSCQELFLARQPLPSFSNEQGIPHHLQQRPTKPKVVGAGDNGSQHQHQQQQQALVDQLFKVAELIETGNSVHARGILARLNHQLSYGGKPLQRAAFYFKEALQLLLNTSTSPHCNQPIASSVSPLDVVFKISAYKVFSEISPFLQFTNFTSNQVLLEALDGFDRIHIVDFDIGIGGQWASFMQELAVRVNGAPSLKITAFASFSSHHPLELGLTRENLTNFANDLNISFEFGVVNLDAVDLSTAMSLPILNLSNNEAVAVNFTIGSSNPPVPLLLRLVKQLSPKIIVSVDHGCVRGDLPFSQHFFHALQSYSFLLESLDAVNVNSDAVYKIEKFLLQPKIESAVLGRHRAGEKMPPWRALFASAGFSPLAFSNFTETQAECMVRRFQVRGFHVEKRQASLYLCWQRGELISVSAWRC